MGSFRIVVLSFIFSFPLLLSQEASPPTPQAPTNPVINERVLSENQSITVQGQKVLYNVHGGSLTVKAEGEKDSADICFIAYFAQPSQEKSSRPIAFCFNGGPGSSSVWLHMGFLGPKILFLPTQANQHPSYKENPLSLLASCDLVFIDPVSTGFSKASNVEVEKKFCGVEGDLRATADFIQIFLTKFQRWQSPKLLIGESYGTTRAVGLTALLQNEYFVNIDGLILISAVLDFQTLESLPSNDLTNILHLPTFAAIAQYHKRLKEPYSEMPLNELSEKVSSFAINEYAPTLLSGSKAQETVKESIANRLSEFTSLPQTFFHSHNLRLGPHEFMRTLLKENAAIVGRLDGRIKTWLPLVESCSYLTAGLDPSFYFVSSDFTCAFNEYLTNDLHWQKDDPYLILNSAALLSWNWDTKTSAPGKGYISFTHDLQNSFAKNPNLKVFVAAGYYDLATPFFAQQYTLDHLFLPNDLCKNVTFKLYEGGHMMYLDEKPRKELASDLFNFVSTLPLCAEE